MDTSEVVIALIALVTPIIIGLLALVNKMHNGRVDALDRREHENNNRHLGNHQRLQATVTEERRIQSEVTNEVFKNLRDVTEKLSDLHASIAGNFISKEDCARRCKELSR